MNLTLVLEENASPEDLRTVSDGLGDYNRAQVGPENYRPLRVFLRDAQKRVVGGLLGSTYWGWCSIDYLWVSEEVRGQGYGQALLEAAEEAARNRDCKNVNLDTMSFQAPAFYQKLGYRIFGQLDDFPTGYTRYYLTKQL
jgi:ribosomal protein S18 acetylase RimI-like enzyme